MNASKLRKMFASGNSGEVRKACGELNDGLAKLESKVAALEAKPIIVPTSYRVVDKAYDDDAARGEAHYGTMNGKAVDLDRLARDVQKHAGTPDPVR
jgi:hypothetical protein